MFRTLLESDAYPSLPCKYLIAENDLALSAAYQKGDGGIAEPETGGGYRCVRCPSGHSPHLTWTEGFAKEVQKFGISLTVQVDGDSE